MNRFVFIIIINIIIIAWTYKTPINNSLVVKIKKIPNTIEKSPNSSIANKKQINKINLTGKPRNKKQINTEKYIIQYKRLSHTKKRLQKVTQIQGFFRTHDLQGFEEDR